MIKKYIVPALVLTVVLSGCTKTGNDVRPLLTSVNMNTLAPYGYPVDYENYTEPTCLLEHPSVNVDPADTYIDYSDKIGEITFKIPYNTKWGPERFRVSEIDYQAPLNDYGFPNAFFGPMLDEKADEKDVCEGWSRAFTLIIDKPITAEKFADLYKDEIPKPSFSTIKNKNGVEIIDKKTVAFGSERHQFVVLGKKNIYTFILAYSMEEKGDREEFNKIIDSVRFL